MRRDREALSASDTGVTPLTGNVIDIALIGIDGVGTDIDRDGTVGNRTRIEPNFQANAITVPNAQRAIAVGLDRNIYRQ